VESCEDDKLLDSIEYEEFLEEPIKFCLVKNSSQKNQ